MKEVLTMRNELLKGLSEEQIKKIEACKNSEEILNLAKAEGIELTDEQLEVVSGGGCLFTIKCDKCGNETFESAFIIKNIPGLVMGSGKDDVQYPLDVVVCKKCGAIMKDGDIDIMLGWGSKTNVVDTGGMKEEMLLSVMNFLKLKEGHVRLSHMLRN